MTKGTRVTQKEKERMWELYQQYGCFKTVGKMMRCDSEIVCKHLQLYETAIAAVRYVTNAKD